MKNLFIYISPMLFYCISCSSGSKPPSKYVHSNPDREDPPRDLSFLYESESLESLEKDRASLPRWKTDSLNSTRIRNFEDAKILLKNVDYSNNDTSIIKQYLENGSVWHFGFDSNFHSLVAFDNSGDLIHVIKW